MKYNYSYSYDNERSAILGRMVEGEFKVFNLAVAEDRWEVFDQVGGHHAWTSQSGISGSGYLNSLGMFVPLGSYQISSNGRRPYAIHWREIAEGVWATVSPAWEEYPCFVRGSYNVSSRQNLVACRVDQIPEAILWLQGEAVDVEPTTLQRTFVYVNKSIDRVYWKEEHKVELRLLNLWGGRLPISPWNFACLAEYSCEDWVAKNTGWEMKNPFPYVVISDETGFGPVYVKTSLIGGEIVGTKVLDENPLEAEEENEWPFKESGYEFIGRTGKTGMAARYGENDVKVIAWRKDQDDRYRFVEENVEKLLFTRKLQSVSEKLTQKLDELCQQEVN